MIQRVKNNNKVKCKKRIQINSTCCFKIEPPEVTYQLTPHLRVIVRESNYLLGHHS